MQIQTKENIREAFLAVIACAWIASFLAAIYFLLKAAFYQGDWWHVFLSAAIAWVLYQVSMHYVLENKS